ncbi:mannosyltransferase [Kickxella alabastrina]|uniref:Mannosyltransferase n=1 Tax=Kickxella alabastrina TaxID=61397 RepID=A0ACC1IPA3_9FUNG|nr:mannosyltransferase [Kickxella alabastrina]
MLHQRRSLKQERAEKRTLKISRKAQKKIASTETTKIHASDQSQTPSTRAAQVSDEFLPSFNLIFRIFSLIRISGALSSPIQDCDEVFNYWEPLHFLQFGQGMQTWEYAPQFALRSYGFLELYRAPVWLLHLVLGFRSKVQVYYGLRIVLALVSAACEAAFVRGVGRFGDRRVARVTALALFGMAGMFHAAVALLPSSFAMYFTALGSAAAMQRRGERAWVRRTLPAVSAFVAASACGWPYAAVAAVPFFIEEIMESGSSCNIGVWWRLRRIAVLALTGAAVSALALGAMVLVDSQYYGHTVVAAWNQVAYNVLGGGPGSELYGTEPWYFYIKNGLVNANIVMILALASLPLWLAYRIVLWLSTRRGQASGAQQQQAVAQLHTSHRLLFYRILPFNLALLVFSLQPHKEERFLTVVYPHLCFSAAVSLSLLHPLAAWLAELLHRGGVRRWVDRLGLALMLCATALGVLRMAALGQYYSAPTRVFASLPAIEKSPTPLPLLPLGPSIKTLFGARTRDTQDTLGGNGPSRVVCLGKDWYRFPSSYWLPAGYCLEFTQSGFDGHLPGSFTPVAQSGSVQASTSAVRNDFNALNLWEPSHVVDSSACDYFVNTEYPHRAPLQGVLGEEEKAGGGWRSLHCLPILDTENSMLLARVLYIPKKVVRLLELFSGSGRWQAWGKMCVYERGAGVGLNGN